MQQGFQHHSKWHFPKSVEENALGFNHLKMGVEMPEKQ